MYNKVIQIGNLTKNIELKYTAGGLAIAKSSIATTHKFKAASGELKEEVCFLEFNIMGKMAETANQYLKKGSKVMLEGRLIFEQWQGSDGQNKSKHSLRVEVMKMLDSKPQDGCGQHQQQNQQSYQQPQQQYNQSQQHPSQSHGATQTTQAPAPQTQGSLIDEDTDEIPF
jgi:single-strand DNA-binding protein